jgi:hypothetical protein
MKITLIAATTALAAVALSGCGAAKSLVNNNLPTVNNLLPLDTQTVAATLGSGRAAISGHAQATVSFADKSIPSASSLSSVTINQPLSTTVTVALPEGATAPQTFTLRNLALQVSVSDGDGTNAVTATGTIAGPLVYTKVSGSSTQYTATAPPSANLTFGGGTLDSLVGIITGAPSPNIARARLSVDADDTELPAGTVLSFVLGASSATLRI